MSVESILAKNARLAAEGKLPTYGPGAVQRTATAAKPKRDALATCAHLGGRLPGQPCGSQLRRCKLHGTTTTRFTKCEGATRCCATCPLPTTRRRWLMLRRLWRRLPWQLRSFVSGMLSIGLFPRLDR